MRLSIEVSPLICSILLNSRYLWIVIGKQLTSLYRYGHMSVCGPKLDEFKFCMTLKGLHPEERREAWIRRRAEWWARRRLEKSSEDVWDIRTCVTVFYNSAGLNLWRIANRSRTFHHRGRPFPWRIVLRLSEG